MQLRYVLEANSMQLDTTLLTQLANQLDNIDLEECGRLIEIKGDLIKIIGLTSAFLHEVIVLENINTFSLEIKRAMILSITEHYVVAACFEHYDLNVEYTIAKRTGKLHEVVVSSKMQAHTVNGFGVATDAVHITGQSCIVNIYDVQPEFTEMGHIQQQIITGMPNIDVITPLGFGQRQLLIGDNNTSRLITNIIKALHDQNDAICIYVSIGQNITSTKLLDNKLKFAGVYRYILMQARAGSTSLEKYIAPFVAVTIANHLRTQGYNVVVFLDDLNTQSRAYQDIMTRMKQPMGRDGYPADLFSMHANVLSMGHAHVDGGSITIFPVVNIPNDDITDYLVTTVMSITDGQIMMYSGSQSSNGVPINISKSVSRIGRSIQTDMFKQLCTQITHLILTYNNLLQLTALSSDIGNNHETKRILMLGKHITEFLLGEDFNYAMQLAVMYLYINEKAAYVNLEQMKAITSLYSGIIGTEELQQILQQYGDANETI
jgi:F-type H+-transporting ATPase subunit alpha